MAGLTEFDQAAWKSLRGCVVFVWQKSQRAATKVTELLAAEVWEQQVAAQPQAALCVVVAQE
jgi:hypothetical protein